MSAWAGRRMLVTGGTGFIGSHMVETLLERGAQVRVVGRSRERFFTVLGPRAKDVEFLEGDLSDPSMARRACYQMQAVCHLAGSVAGVGYNHQHPGTIFTANVEMGVRMLDAAARAGVDRFLCMSSACVYRRDCIVPTPESEGFVGDPEPTNFGYGWAKRVLEVQARCYAQEFPMQIAIVRPYNAYGPRDNFNWETSHVIPALIRKAVEGHDPIVLWGDGTQSRSFLYVSDFVEGSLLALEWYAACDPVHIGTTEEITVAELMRLILELSGRQAKVVCDTTKPQGQPRRLGDFTKAKTKLGFSPAVPLREGLRRTIAWYLESRATCAAPSSS